MSYREFVLSSLRKEGDPDLLLHGILGLAGEAGEVADEYKKSRCYGRPLDRGRLLNEMGDVRWYLELLCSQLGVTLEELEALNRKKLEERRASEALHPRKD